MATHTATDTSHSRDKPQHTRQTNNTGYLWGKRAKRGGSGLSLLVTVTAAARLGLGLLALDLDLAFFAFFALRGGPRRRRLDLEEGHPVLGGPVLVQAQAEELVALRVLELLQVARAGGAARRRGDLL